MVRFSVCIEMLLTEYPFAERARKAAELGFGAIEFWLPDEKGKDMKAVRQITQDCGILVSSIAVNSNAGDIGGSLVKARDKSMYLKRLTKTIETAHMLDCEKMITCSGNVLKGLSRQRQTRNAIRTLKEGCRVAEKEGITLLLEPLNTTVDHSGYFVDSARLGFEIVRDVGSPNLKLVYDVYHMQMMEGNILQTIERNLKSIAHIHCAGAPGRHELDLGELDYRNILKKIDELGYDGLVGLEYHPTVGSEESLKRAMQVAQYDN
jgi:hydroxypyruvate isomerase